LDDNKSEERETISYIDQYKSLSENYSKSLMVYFYEGSQSHYAMKAPLMPFSFGIFFISAIAIWIKRKRELLILIPFLLILPFTNSAITDIVNADHRITPLLTFTSLAVATGIISFLDFKFKPNWLHLIYKSMILAFFLMNIYWIVLSFYMGGKAGEQVHNSRPVQEYLLMHTVKIIEKETSAETLCINLSDENYKIFDIMHFREQFLYFNEGKDIKLTSNDQILENTEIYLTTDCAVELEEVEFANIEKCYVYSKYLCPDKKTNYDIFIQKELANQ
jgi:hypothetical protein